MRILLSNESRKDLFDFLMKKYESKSLKELSKKLNKPFKTFNNWRYNYKKYLPDYLIKECNLELSILDVQPDNWGMIKGGNTDIEKKRERIKKLWHDPKYYELRRKIGKLAIKNLIKGMDEKMKKRIFETKIKKRKEHMQKLELENNYFFTNQEIKLDNTDIYYSKNDKIKNIKFPDKITPELAEEIGVHLGDGCLSFSRKYFSVKTNKKERGYMVNFLFPLYKKLYNIDLKLMELPSVVGFEICSQALFDFKNKVLKIPYGNKVDKISVPRAILESKNKEVYSSFIRGLFDTDGCVYIVKSKKNYPIINFTIKSEQLMKEAGEMLKKMGFIPYIGKYQIALNGNIMLQKWIKEINSNNPKNLLKLQQASNSARIE